MPSDDDSRSDRVGASTPGRDDQAGRQPQRRRIPAPAAGAGLRLHARQLAAPHAALVAAGRRGVGLPARRRSARAPDDSGRGRGRAPDHPAAEAAHAGPLARRGRSGDAHQARQSGPVYARDIEAHSAVTIVNPDQLLFTVQDDRDIGGELYVNKGRGYVEAEQHPVDRTMPVDVVRVDSIYNPVRRANFTVAETRVGQRTDYDRLTLTVETN